MWELVCDLHSVCSPTNHYHLCFSFHVCAAWNLKVYVSCFDWKTYSCSWRLQMYSKIGFQNWLHKIFTLLSCLFSTLGFIYCLQKERLNESDLVWNKDGKRDFRVSWHVAMALTVKFQRQLHVTDYFVWIKACHIITSGTWWQEHQPHVCYCI